MLQPKSRCRSKITRGLLFLSCLCLGAFVNFVMLHRATFVMNRREVTFGKVHAPCRRGLREEHFQEPEEGLAKYLYIQPLMSLYANRNLNFTRVRAEELLDSFRGREASLWRNLRSKYGQSPPVTLAIRPRAPAFEGVGFPNKNMVIELLLRVAKVMDRNKIQYVAYGGTSISFCRHNGQLNPFDDDLDLLISKVDAPKLRKLLEELPATSAYGKVEVLSDREGQSCKKSRARNLSSRCASHPIFIFFSHFSHLLSICFAISPRVPVPLKKVVRAALQHMAIF